MGKAWCGGWAGGRRLWKSGSGGQTVVVVWQWWSGCGGLDEQLGSGQRRVVCVGQLVRGVAGGCGEDGH